MQAWTSLSEVMLRHEGYAYLEYDNGAAPRNN